MGREQAVDLVLDGLPLLVDDSQRGSPLDARELLYLFHLAVLIEY